MKKLLLTLLLIPAAAFAAATNATESQTTTCTLNGQTRVIELTSGEQGCEVKYTKGEETKTLWSSTRAEFCAEKATAFVEKQKGWGYQCEAKAAGGDTAALGGPDWERITEGLTDPQRAVVTLFYYEDMPLKEVARALDMPEGTVKTHLSRARAALRERYREAHAGQSEEGRGDHDAL